MVETLIGLVVLIALVGALVNWLKRRNPGGEIISIVYLLREPRPLSENTVRDILSNALDVDFDGSAEEPENFVLEVPPPPVEGMPPGRVTCFMVRLGDLTYSLNNFAIPYMPDKEAAVAGVPDGRLQRAILEHNAWLSMDLMNEPESENAEEQQVRQEAAYRTIGRAMAGLAGPDVLALFCPQLDRCNEYDESLLETLRSDDPLAIFDDPTFAPVLHMDGDDPRMQEAVAEARQRWPEFASAFAGPTNGETSFLIKAKFEEGENAEFMWVSVTGIEGDIIYGTLENTPNTLKNITEGDSTETPAADIFDWMYSDGEQAVGGFTQKVIAEHYGG